MRPDPKGPCPDDWKPNHWLAFLALDEGKSYREAGQLVDPPVVAGTISRWVSQWRSRYGRDVVVSKRASAFTPEAREAGALAAGTTTSLRWQARRLALADDFGAASESALDLASKIVTKASEDPLILDKLTVSDAYRLGRLSEVFARRADTLAGIGAPGRNGPAPDAPDPGGEDEEDIFAAFNEELGGAFGVGAGDDGRFSEVLRQVQIVATEIRTERGDSVVEVSES